MSVTVFLCNTFTLALSWNIEFQETYFLFLQTNLVSLSAKSILVALKEIPHGLKSESSLK